MRILLLFSLLFIYVFANDDLRQKALSKGLSSIPLDFEILKAQVDDKNLSLDRTIYCASCHDIKKGGEDSIPTAIGYKKQKISSS